MKKIQSTRFYWTLLFSFLTYRPAFAVIDSSQKKLVNKVADAYVKAFPSKAVTALHPSQAAEKKFKAVERVQVTLSDVKKRTVVLNEVFAKSGLCDDYIAQSPYILNIHAWKDLHLFCGDTATPSFNLLSRINRTITTLGECALTILLATPTHNIKKIEARQQVIQLLRTEKGVYDLLKTWLTTFSKQESSMLSFWTDTDPLYTKEYNTYMNNLFYTKSKSVNHSAKSLQWRKILKRDVYDIGLNFVFYPCLGLVPYGIALVFAKDPKVKRKLYGDYIPFYDFYHARKMIGYEHIHGNVAKTFRYMIPAWVTVHSLWQYYKGYANYKEYAAVLRNLAGRMASVQAFVHTIEKINALIVNHPKLEEVYGKNLTAIRELLSLTSQNGQLGELVTNLKNMPLTSWSYFFNNAGKLLASPKLFIAHKGIFHNAMYELGQLDAFLGMATLMEEVKAKKSHTYNFVTLLPRNQKKVPYIAIKEMWNPFLDPTVAVGNSIEMDGAKGGLRNMILTGPNAGGKSTFLTGITNTLLLSQVFGIAPAKEVTLTPFDKLNTYIDVTDDIAAGKSLFMAEVDRFQKHLKLLKALKKEEFSFTIFDEPFSGTNPTEGAAAEYSVLNYIAKYTNVLNIVATHYPIVMLLEEKSPQKGFKNYKVFINYHGRGEKIDYTYKVVPGKSNQAIAIDILEEQGYATEMLEQARDIIAHPNKYQETF
ncbi:MAG: hypothetical protein K2X94_05320 [Amoebophilaceae bacterium]|nr:hypothetical protein [Amoebophilaceae bacterium]